MADSMASHATALLCVPAETVVCWEWTPFLRATCMLQAQRASLQKKLEERQADLEARKAALAAVRAGALVCAMRPLMFKAPQFISLDVDHCNWL